MSGSHVIDDNDRDIGGASVESKMGQQFAWIARAAFGSFLHDLIKRQAGIRLKGIMETLNR